MKNGVPFHIAFGIRQSDIADFELSMAEAAGMQIIFSELDGAVRFNFNTNEFDPVEPK